MHAAMKILLLCGVVLMGVETRPQDFVFPEPAQGQENPGNRPPTRPRPGTDNTQLPQPPPTQPTPSTTTTASADATTTRIPPRDPGNRIVYTVSCPCQFTPQYMPVCGTDGQTYGNMGVLQCARQCGTKVEVYLLGACGRNNG